MKLALVVATVIISGGVDGCHEDVPSIKNDAGDPSDQLVNPTNTYWETKDFKTDTKIQLHMDFSGVEFDTEGNVMQMFAWDHLTPTSIEMFMCDSPCVMRGLDQVSFSTADKFTSLILPQDTTMATWTLVQSSTFP
jgi:hypothetical protein